MGDDKDSEKKLYESITSIKFDTWVGRMSSNKQLISTYTVL